MNARRERLLNAILTYPGRWDTSRARRLYTQTDPGAVRRRTAQHDLQRLCRAGHLALITTDPNHHYYIPTWKDTPVSAQPKPLPHDPYIEAVIDALTAAWIAPVDHWTSDTETDRYDTGPDAGCTTMLSAYIDWDTAPAHEHGIALIWEGPAEEWMWAPRADGGHLAYEPEFLPLGQYADPSAVVAVVRALMAGEALPEEPAPDWHGTDAVKRAVAAWAETDA